MARKSHFDFYLELLNRCLLAWEAIRLNPKFRADYEKHKQHIDWLRIHYIEAMSQGITPEMEWVRKFSDKWNLSLDDVIRWNPLNKSTYLEPITEFSLCKRKCIQFNQDARWGFTVCCKSKKPNKHNATPCFASYQQSITSLPLASRLNGIYVYRDSHPLTGINQTSTVKDFIRTESRKNRLLLWVRSDALREVAQLQILEQVRKAKQRSPRQRSEGRLLIKSKADNGYIVLSIALHAPSHKILSAARKALRTAVPTYPFSQIANLWESLQIYDEHINKEVPIGRMIENKYGPRKARYHKSQVSVGDSSTYGRYFTDRINRAKRLIKDNTIPPPQLARPTAKKGSRKSLLSTLLPKLPPPLK